MITIRTYQDDNFHAGATITIYQFDDYDYYEEDGNEEDEDEFFDPSSSALSAAERN